MVREYHQLNGHEFQQSPGDSEGQGSQECYSPQGHKVSGMTWQVNTTTVSKNPPVNLRDMGSIPGLGKFHISWGK